MRCSACQRQCRKTSLAHVARAWGELTRGRVCSSCFSGAFHIVASVTVATAARDEVKEARRDSKIVTAAAVKKLRGIEKARGGRDVDLIAEGIGQAADFLEAGDY